MEEKVNSKHSITIVNRGGGTLTGVKKVVSAFADAISLETELGPLVLSGKDLKIMKYDVGDGNLSFEGDVSGIKYSGEKKPLLKRLFK